MKPLFETRRFILLGAGLGLFISRIAAEAQANPWPWPVTVVVILLSIPLGVSVANWFRHRLDLAPLVVLWIYVLWPKIDPGLAANVAFVGIFSFIILHLKTFPAIWVDALIFFASLVLYLHTLAPTILPADSGEFQFVASILGIAHPPGYPLYTLLGKLFTFIPVGDTAYRVNLLSAVAAAFTLVLISRTVRMATSSALAGALAALVLGGSTTFWAQATTANIRMLTAFFAALILFAAVAYAQEKKTRNFVLLAIAAGLGITHHLSLIILLLPTMVYIWLVDRDLLLKRPLLFRSAVAFFFSLSPILYIPLRAPSAPFGGQGLRNLENILRHILGLGFQGDLFFFASPQAMPERLRILGNILDFQFGVPILLLTILGGFLLLRDRPRLFLLWGGGFAFLAFVGITYRAPQTVEYLMPAYLPMVLALGYGVARISGWRRGYPTLNSLFLAGSFLLGFWQLAAHYSSYLELSRDRSAREYAEGIVSGAPQEATVLTNWHWATALWYMQYVEGEQPDLEIDYIFPRGDEPIAETWSRRLARSVELGPTVITGFYPEFRTATYRFYPLGDAFLVQQEPSFTIPQGLIAVHATFGDRIRLIGYQTDETAPGEPLVFDLFWQPVVQLDQDYSLFLHMVGPDGSVVGQMDVFRPTSRYEPGEILHDRFMITPLPTLPPGNLRLIAGAYFVSQSGAIERLTTESGQDFVELEEVEWQPKSQSLPSLDPLYRRFGSGLVLTGVDYDTTLPGTRRVYLHWHRPTEVSGELQYRLTWNREEVAHGLIPDQVGDFLTTADLPGGAWPLEIEVYADGNPTVPLGPWNLPMSTRVALPGSGSGVYIDIGNEMLLVGKEIPIEGLSPGREFTVELQILSLRPLTHDYSFSVRIGDSPPVDTSPTLGAIPTLKWIQGSAIYDRHFLEVPENAPPGKDAITLVVYDAFTLRSLPVLDDRIVRLGAEIRLGEVEIASP